MTDEQNNRLQALADASNVSVPRLLLESALGAPTTSNRTVLRELAGVRRILTGEATNINQAAHAANSGSFAEEEWDEIRKGIAWRNERLSEQFGWSR